MTHKEAIQHTIKLAKCAKENDIRPNPFVGALIVDQHGQVIGTGYHQKLGGPHAEVFAIEAALKKQSDLSACSLYVSLEPCSHHGKTPPCCDLILQHHIKKVIIGSLDPNPKVNGVEFLQSNGVDVVVEVAQEAVELNARFFTNHQFNRPYYILKTASTIDGKIADYKGESKWITNSISRQFVHTNLRSSVDAILTSYKTVVQDQAQFNIRYEDGATEEKNVVIIDKDLTLLDQKWAHLPIFNKRSQSKIYFITANQAPANTAPFIELIHEKFVNDLLQFDSINEILLEKGISKILTEGGRILNSNLIQQKLVDELYWFIAPKLLNDFNGLSMFGIDQAKDLQNSLQLKLISTNQFDQDILLHYRINY